jgi:hypothetical protein
MTGGFSLARGDMADSQSSNFSKKQETNSDRQKAEQARRANIKTAWAVVRPFPGKEKVMAAQLQQRRVEVYRPMLLRQHKPLRQTKEKLLTTPYFPGYVFIRPMQGSRWQIVDNLFVAHHLNIVLFDSVISAWREYEEEAASVVQAEFMARVRRLGGKRVARSLADLATIIADEPVDTNRLDQLFKGLKSFERGTIRLTATFDEYLSTDRLAA